MDAAASEVITAFIRACRVGQIEEGVRALANRRFSSEELRAIERGARLVDAIACDTVLPCPAVR